MSAPRISVMMPCYNAVGTLQMALASLLAQTFEDWECVIVDDGSVESPAPILEQANDCRFRLITLRENYGRGAARQVALDHSRGEFLAMLDADDWMFPNRLADQLDVISNDARLALVSSPVAIVDRANDLIAVRPRTCQDSRVREVHVSRPTTFMPIHPSSMIRMSVARKYSFDTRYRVAEDFDFLLRLLIDRTYATLPQIAYSYAESADLTLDKVLASQASTRDILRQHRDRYPMRSSWLIGLSHAKSAVYRAAFVCGAERRLVERRSSPPSDEDMTAFARARASVEIIRSGLFGEPRFVMNEDRIGRG